MTEQRRDYGDLLVLVGLAAFTLWYLLDAMRVSMTPQNLLFILPVAVLVLGIIALELIMRARQGTLLQAGNDEPLRRTLPVVVLFAVYVLSLETLGFDIASTLFLAAFLVLKGERNWWLLIGFSLAFGLGTALFFSQMLPYPMTLRVLPG